MKFTIEKVAKLTGIPATTLRNWERRYGFPKPIRGESGHRHYCCNDVEFLKKVKTWVDTGHCLPDISQRYNEDVQQRPMVARDATQFVDDVDYRVSLMYEGLLDFDSRVAIGHFTILNAKLSPELLFDRVFEALLRRINSDRVQGRISVAQEHFANTFIRLRLASFMSLVLPPTHEETVLAATLSHENHEEALLLVAAHLKFRGYMVNYLGSDLPVTSLMELVDVLAPDCVLLSFEHPQRVLEDLPSILQIEQPICLGGSAFYDTEFVNALRPQLPARVQVSQHVVGSHAASFVEMIAQSKIL